MRSTLASALSILALWAIPAAQAQTLARPTSGPAVTSGYQANPLAKRLFFFMPDSKNMGRPTVVRPAAQSTNAKVLFRPAVSTQSPGFSKLRFTPTGLIPLESPNSQEHWRFLKPKNTKLFFFSKP